MKFETWEPIYNDILDEFGFLKKDDELARDILVKMNPKMRIGNLKKFRNSFKGNSESCKNPTF